MCVQGAAVSNGMLREILLVGFGWLLGVLGALGVESLRARSRKKQVAAGIRTELAQLRVRLALMASSLSRHLGVLDAGTVDWLVSTLDDSAEIGEHRDLCDHLQELKKTGQLAAAVSTAQAASEDFSPPKSIHLARLDVPFLDANLHLLPAYGATTQRNLLHMRSQLAIMNDKIQETVDLLHITYDPGIGAENRSSIRGNLRTVYAYLLERCQYLADLIPETKLG